MAPERIQYEDCPLCASNAIVVLREDRCDWHAMYRERLPPTMRWMTCQSCRHQFVDGYFNEAALGLLFSGAHSSQIPGDGAEAQRYVWAPTVERVTSFLRYPLGAWLDVGVGNGSLLFTAQEWGYRTVGLDLRANTAIGMRELGIPCYCVDLLDYHPTERYHAISFCDVLEHVPYPKVVLEHARRLLDDDGVLLLSMPNCESPVWQMLDHAGSNPYWGEIEHYHNFSRQRLVRLLDETGFDFLHYNVSPRWRVTMEVLARPRH